MSIFIKRAAVKPFKYPHLIQYMKAIQHSYWIVDEFKFDKDVQDYRVKLTEHEREVVKRTALCISQIESGSVKTFWGDVYKTMPHSEIASVGYTFADSEVRHFFAYAQLIEDLGLNDEFELLTKEPVIQGRIEYLTKYLKNASSNSKEEYTLTLLLFSAFIENCSLFSQFLILKSFSKFQNTMTVVDNVVVSTAKEEAVHSMFGAELVKIVRKENPEWFNDEFKAKIQRACKKAFNAEMDIVKWIFEKGELDFLPINVIEEFLKDRFNQSMIAIDIEPIFEVDQDILKQTQWFDEEILAYNRNDFFSSQSAAYSKRTQSISEDDLF